MDEPRWRRYLRFWRRDPARDVDEELQFHFAERIAQYEAEGASHEEATAAARERFGDVTEVRAELVGIERSIVRRLDLATWIDAASHDVRYAVRTLCREPAFTAAVVVTLALAIGVNLTVMSLLDQLFFRQPAGVVDVGTVRRLYGILPNLDPSEPAFPYFSYSEYQAIRSATRGMARVAIDVATDSADVAYGRSVNVVGVSYATADLLPLLGVRVERGRVFSEAEDDVKTPAPVAVISRRFADRVFGAEVNPLGSELRVESRNYRVIGVVAPSFAGLGLGEISVWMPFNTQSPLMRDFIRNRLVVRLSAGADPRTVEARATAAYQRTHRPAEKAYAGAAIVVAPLAEARGPRHRSREEMIATRIGVFSLILLVIACANVASLLLARSWTRRREFAVRAALGITRARLATLVFLEGLILAAAAGGMSLLVGRWTVGMLRTQLLPRVRWSSVVIGPRTLLLSVAITLVVAVLAGIAPVAFASRHDAADALKSGTRFGTARRGRLRGALLVVQAAFAIVLFVGALLFAKSLRNVRGVDLGYDVDRLIVASVYFPDRTPHPEDAPLIQALVTRIAALPGVAGALATYGGPLDSWSGYPLYHETADATDPIKMMPFIGVGPDYFRLSGTRILKGRSFVPSDRRGSAPVIVVGAGMAKRLWPHESALGKCLRPITRSRPCYSIVGVAEDVHLFNVVSPEPEPDTQYYFPLDQLPTTDAVARTLIVRAGTSEADVIADTVRQLLGQTFPSEEVRARAMTRALEREMRPWILGARLFALLGAAAVLLAIVGVYAMAEFDTRRRTREIGVRIALGASGASVMSLFLRDGTIVVGIGVVLGVVVAFAGARFVESALYGVSSRDPALLVGSAAVLLLVAVGASALSAWRATRVDPVVVLRDE